VGWDDNSKVKKLWRDVGKKLASTFFLNILKEEKKVVIFRKDEKLFVGFFFYSRFLVFWPFGICNLL
jgi:hypothetical protein